MTVAELKNILSTMNDTDEVIFLRSHIDIWSEQCDGYSETRVDKITTREEFEEEER